MSRRKGEMTPASVDSGWPHQVALAEEHCQQVAHCGRDGGNGLANYREFFRHAEFSGPVACYLEVVGIGQRLSPLEGTVSPRGLLQFDSREVLLSAPLL